MTTSHPSASGVREWAFYNSTPGAARRIEATPGARSSGTFRKKGCFAKTEDLNLFGVEQRGVNRPRPPTG